MPNAATPSCASVKGFGAKKPAMASTESNVKFPDGVVKVNSPGTTNGVSSSIATPVAEAPEKEIVVLVVRPMLLGTTSTVGVEVPLGNAMSKPNGLVVKPALLALVAPRTSREIYAACAVEIAKVDSDASNRTQNFTALLMRSSKSKRDRLRCAAPP